MIYRITYEVEALDEDDALTKVYESYSFPIEIERVEDETDD